VKQAAAGGVGGRRRHKREARRATLWRFDKPEFPAKIGQIPVLPRFVFEPLPDPGDGKKSSRPKGSSGLMNRTRRFPCFAPLWRRTLKISTFAWLSAECTTKGGIFGKASASFGWGFNRIRGAISFMRLSPKS
jgi:hypothetical protein